MGSQCIAHPNLGGRIVTSVAGRIVTTLLRQAGRIVTTLRRQFRYRGTGGVETLVRSKLLIAVLIITLSVVYYLFGMDYINQRRENAALTSQITEATEALAQMPEPPQNLEQRLEAAQASLDAEQSVFPSNLHSTEVVNTILGLADDCGIRAIPLVTQSWSTEVVGEHSYDVLRLTVAAEGNFTQLASFVSKLENGEYQTLVVEDLSITRVPGGESASEEAIAFIASFDLAIYAQSLTSD